MQAIRCLILMITVLFVGSWSWAAEKVLTVAFGRARPPYVFAEKGQIRGIEVDLAREALSRLGYSLNPHSLSSYRIEAEVKHGNSFDVVIGVPWALDRPRYYSKPFISFENVVIGFKSRKMSLKSVKDLKGLRVGTWVNGWKELGRDFAKEFSPRSSGAMADSYFEFANQGLQFKALWDEDIDVMIMDRYIFGWFRVTLESQLDVSRDIEFFPLFAVPIHSYVAFRDQKMRKAFNRELLKMRESGEYERIVQSYVGEKIAAMFKTNGKTH